MKDEDMQALEHWELFNHTKTWTTSDVRELASLWYLGYTVEACARRFGRTKLAIVCKLLATDVDFTDHLEALDTNTWYNVNFSSKPDKLKQTTIQQEKKMDKFTEIKQAEQTVKKLNESLTLGDYVMRISDLEKAIETLNKIANKPNAVIACIAKHQADINALVAKCNEQIPS